MAKNKKLHRNLHPVHWHVSMFLAIAALLLTSFKSSEEMLRALRALPVHAAVFENVHLRDTETGEVPVILSLTRHSLSSGK